MFGNFSPELLRVLERIWSRRESSTERYNDEY
jgi:hypothetical protein